MTGEVAVSGKLLADFSRHAGVRQLARKTVPQRMKAQPANVAARRAGAFTRYARINAGGGHDPFESHRQAAFPRAALGRQPGQHGRPAYAGG